MVLAMHDYAITHGKGQDKRWYTFVPDESKSDKRRKIRKQTREELIDYLYDYYFVAGNSEDAKNLLLPFVFDRWIAYRLSTTNRETTVRRNETDFRKYYLNEPLSKDLLTTPLNLLTKNDLEEWAYRMIKKYHLTQKAYSNMTLIIRQIYTYLVDENILEQNTFERVHIRTSAFRKTRKKSAQSQIFFPDEIEAIFRSVSERLLETNDEAYLAIPMMYYTGIRIGECLALKFEDFDQERGTLCISRSLIRRDRRNEDGSWNTSRYVIEDYLKQNADPRTILVTDECFEILQQIRAIRKVKGYISPYLFEVKTPNNIEMKLYRICDELEIPRRSPHKLRKTYVSELMNSRLDPDFIRTQVGHKDLLTTWNAYTYTTTRDEEMLRKIADAL